MTIGADRKRLGYLAAVVVIGGAIAFWANSSNSDSSPSRAARQSQTVAPTAAAPSENSDIERAQRRRSAQNRSSSEWNPVYRDPKVVVDALKVDPTLRLDLLAKVQRVEIDPAQRNLFQFGAAPPPMQPATPMPHPGVISMGQRPPPLSTPGPPVIAGPPTAPPIPLKYYGYANPRAVARKRAFFLDGEDIIIAGEGELIKKRYKLVKIGVNSVTMEDTQFNNDQQTLPLAQDLAT